MNRSGIRWAVATLILAALVALAVGRLVAGYMRAAAVDAARVDARLRANLLDSEIARFRLLPLALRDDRDVGRTLAGDDAARVALDAKLAALADETGATVIYLVGPDGVAVSASNWRSPQSFVGGDYGFRRYVRDARRDGQATQFALGTISRHPGLFLAARTGAGVLVVKLEFDRLEAAWRAAGGTTLVRDAAGVVLVTSRPDWRFRAVHPLPAAVQRRLRAEASLPAASLGPLPRAPAHTVQADIATAQPGWRLTLRRADPRTAGTTAALAAGGAALAVVLAAALAWGLRQRGRLARRRTAELEAAVAARTAALTREIEERAASEARAAELREGLRQANRLATLGQVTASVAHETAQPVAAIRTYAQTSALLLDRGDMATVRENLSTIARLSDRIGAVTAELRGFARRRAGAVRAVPLGEVVDGAVLILRDQLRSVTLDRPAIDPALAVMGGRVRLEQVLVNILQNAIEALAGCARPRIVVTLAADADCVTLTVADTGPGIPPDVAARLFTPFVTSRPNGLGLGLVIAHDIMVELGGSLRLVESDSGATFRIAMRRA